VERRGDERRGEKKKTIFLKCSFPAL